MRVISAIVNWVQNIKTASYNSARTNLNPDWFLCSYMIWEADFQSRFLCNTKKICFTGTNCIIKIPIFSLILSTIFFQHWVDNANLKELISLDVDASDNLTEEALFNFINVYGPQLKGRQILNNVFIFKNELSNHHMYLFMNLFIIFRSCFVWYAPCH